MKLLKFNSRLSRWFFVLVTSALILPYIAMALITFVRAEVIYPGYDDTLQRGQNYTNVLSEHNTSVNVCNGDRVLFRMLRFYTFPNGEVFGNSGWYGDWYNGLSPGTFNVDALLTGSLYIPQGNPTGSYHHVVTTDVGHYNNTGHRIDRKNASDDQIFTVQ